VTGPAAIQVRLVDNHCFGCGADNPDGLQLKSAWVGDGAVATWSPGAAHAAGPRHLVNGGIIATVLDCHGVCTAIADAHEGEGREIGTEPEIWCATASLTVDYLRPTPLGVPLELRSHVVERDDRRTTVDCVLEAEGKERARARVVAVRVPAEWKHGGGA
jgi:acyl-coenzyme A thioesterase PaaI-like protein